MSNFNEANQARQSLKMLLSFYSWYHSSAVASENGDFIILVTVLRMDNKIRKVVPIVHQNVSVKLDVIAG